MDHTTAKGTTRYDSPTVLESKDLGNGKRVAKLKIGPTEHCWAYYGKSYTAHYPITRFKTLGEFANFIAARWGLKGVLTA